MRLQRRKKEMVSEEAPLWLIRWELFSNNGAPTYSRKVFNALIKEQKLTFKLKKLDGTLPTKEASRYLKVILENMTEFIQIAPSVFLVPGLESYLTTLLKVCEVVKKLNEDNTSLLFEPKTSDAFLPLISEVLRRKANRDMDKKACKDLITSIRIWEQIYGGGTFLNTLGKVKQTLKSLEGEK